MKPHHDIARPVAGHYRRRLVRGGPWVPVRIWYGPPADPETGEELDRSPRWQAQVGDEIRDGVEEWPSCCNNPIDAAEWRYLMAERDWCREFAPDEPAANPTKPIDLGALKPLF